MKALSPPAKDPELEEFKRRIDLVEYARKSGYEVHPSESNERLTFLEHPHGDRIVVARNPSGQWIYASVNDYEPRSANESPQHALQRLRDSIARTMEKGTIVEFVQHRDYTVALPPVSLEVVRERLRAYTEAGLAFNVAWPRHQDGDREARYTRAAREAVRPASERAVATETSSNRAGFPLGQNPELGRRRYDWMPSPAAPPETEVEQRLRRWREAQEIIDQAIFRRAHARSDEQLLVCSPVARPAGKSLGSVEGNADGKSGSSKEKSELGRRRYDWTPQPKGIGAISRAPRDRNQDRGR